LIKEYDIEFLGPEREHRWPDRYRATFAEARNVRACFFEDLKRGARTLAGRPLSLPADILQERSLCLKRAVVPPGPDPVNERTLRVIETLVFSRFMAEVKW
jgi:hypothetical protein